MSNEKVEEKKKKGGKAVKSIKNNNTGVMANKIDNTNLRAKVKTKTGINDTYEVVEENVKSKKKSSKFSDEEADDLKRKLKKFAIFMIICFIIYYAIVAMTSNKSDENYFDDTKNAVVAVGSYDGNDLIKNGTGFIYKKDNNYGYIATSYNTIRDGKLFRVRLGNNTVDASLLGKDKYLNLAVLSVDKSFVKKTVKFANSDKIKKGTSLYAIGMPDSNNRRLFVTKGLLSNKSFIDVKVDGHNYAMNVLKTTVSVGKGDSGAPLSTNKGLVVGMIVSRVNDENITYAIPINDIKDNLYMFEKGNHINRPYIGITVFDVSNYDLINKYKLNSKVDSSLRSGVVVNAVKGSSKAYNILKRGDVVTKVGNDDINNVAKFRYELFKYSVGDTVKLTINRNGSIKNVSFVVTKLD